MNKQTLRNHANLSKVKVKVCLRFSSCTIRAYLSKYFNALPDFEQSPKCQGVFFPGGPFP